MRILEEALTFDDVLLVPAYSEVLPREVSLSSQLTRDIRVNLPVVSAAMDTVTEARLAITIAQEGGIGIIHKNMSIESQAREVDRVKKFESGVISDPISVTPDMSIRDVIDLTRAKNISGVPVVRRQAGRGDRHAPRPALRDQARCAGVLGDDAQGAPRHGARERPQGRGARAAAQAPHRESPGGHGRSRAQGHDHRQGLPEGHGISERLQRRRRKSARRRGGGHDTRHAGSRRGVARGGRRRGGRRYLARSLARRARDGRPDQEAHIPICRSSAATS